MASRSGHEIRKVITKVESEKSDKESVDGESDQSDHTDKADEGHVCHECGHMFKWPGNVIRHWKESCPKNPNRIFPKKSKLDKNDQKPKIKGKRKKLISKEADPIPIKSTTDMSTTIKSPDEDDIEQIVQFVRSGTQKSADELIACCLDQHPNLSGTDISLIVRTSLISLKICSREIQQIGTHTTDPIAFRKEMATMCCSLTDYTPF